MKMRPPQYNGKDNRVMLIVTVPFSVIINSIIFGKKYFSSLPHFLFSTLLSVAFYCIFFMACGMVAIALKKRFPQEEKLLFRLALMIFTFLLMSGLWLYMLFSLYEAIPFFQYRFNENDFAWSYYLLGLINIFLTFLMEGISRFKGWKQNWQETEHLQETYKKTQLNGLRSQVNPHFLFNSLNSLSALIQEDEEKAEKFLDEMSKVYRYMLRNDEEQLVTLQSEIAFVQSYINVLNARYGSGLVIRLEINENCADKMLAPLTLQVIIENCFSLNTVSKSSPLHITIAANNGQLVVKNNLQAKMVTDVLDFEAGLDNLVKKYQLLNMPVEVSEQEATCRIITIPLFNKKEEVPV